MRQLTNTTLYIIEQIKPVDINPSTYIDFNKENNKKGSKFKVSDHVRISKHKNIFVKGYVPDWFEEVFLLKKLRTLCCRYVISNRNGEEIAETFYKNELQKTSQKEFRVEKVIKKAINCMLNGKATIILLTVGLIRRTQYK